MTCYELSNKKNYIALIMKIIKVGSILVSLHLGVPGLIEVRGM